MGSFERGAGFTFERYRFQNCLDFFPAGSIDTSEPFVSAAFVIYRQARKTDADFPAVSKHNLRNRTAISQSQRGRYVQDALVGNYKQDSFDGPQDEPGKNLLYKRRGLTPAGCVKDYFAREKKRSEKDQFPEKFSLLSLDCRLVYTFVVRKRDRTIYRQTVNFLRLKPHSEV
jgi:hypothetical protein